MIFRAQKDALKKFVDWVKQAWNDAKSFFNNNPFIGTIVSIVGVIAATLSFFIAGLWLLIVGLVVAIVGLIIDVISKY